MTMMYISEHLLKEIHEFLAIVYLIKEVSETVLTQQLKGMSA